MSTTAEVIAMLKHIPVAYSDGRIGWPSVVEYVISEGPKKGERLPVPPSYESHGIPPEMERAQAREGFRDTFHNSTWPFHVDIHEEEIYEHNLKLGVFSDPRHCGTTAGIVVDSPMFQRNKKQPL